MADGVLRMADGWYALFPLRFISFHKGRYSGQLTVAYAICRLP